MMNPYHTVSFLFSFAGTAMDPVDGRAKLSPAGRALLIMRSDPSFHRVKKGPFPRAKYGEVDESPMLVAESLFVP